MLLEKRFVGNHSRWHRLTADATVPDLGPRALLYVWPDLSTDVPSVLRTMSPDFTDWAVVEHADGRIHSLSTTPGRPVVGMRRPPFAMVSARNLAPELGPRMRSQLPAITTDKVGSRKLSSGMVGRHHSKAHTHRHNEILVYVVEGWAATLAGPDLSEVLIACTVG
ncbi:hypothetical protein [Actinophytocola sediminis]